MLSVELKTSMCRMFLHQQDGVVDRQEDIINAVIMSESLDELRDVRSIRFGAYEAILDHAAGHVMYPGMHADPIYTWESDGRIYMEITIYGYDKVDVGRNALLSLARGGSVNIPIDLPDQDGTDHALKTVLVHGDAGWYLHVECNNPAEIIWQRVRHGTFMEERHELPAGVHRIQVPPGHADYYGVAVNVQDNGRDAEHKHIIYGRIGGGGGRDLVTAGGNVFRNNSGHTFRYRAAVVEVAGGARVEDLKVLASQYDEVEFMVEASSVESYQSLASVGKLTTFGHADHAPDIVLLIPEEGGTSRVNYRRDKVYAYLLFADTMQTGFYDLARRAQRAIQAAPDWALILDRTWFNATVSYEPDGSIYGASYAYPHLDKSALEFHTRYGFIAYRKQLCLRSTPCNGCNDAGRCRGITGFPWLSRSYGAPHFVTHELGCSLNGRGWKELDGIQYA